MAFMMTSMGRRGFLALLLLCVSLWGLLAALRAPVSPSVIQKCKSIRKPAGRPIEYDPSARTESDRYVPGTPPVLIKNAKILTGARNGTEVVFGDILMDKGVVQALGYVPASLITNKVSIVDANGKYITPGLVDLHTHLGVDSVPFLSGSSDGNSRHQPINPFLRSIDGLNTHDESYKLAIAGGVTVAQVLPGSANNIGGQAVLIKLRSTEERSVSSMVLDPPRNFFIDSTADESDDYIPWRHMKHACGENPDRLYGQTRMDTVWNFRHAYDQARDLMEKQDSFCEQVEQTHAWSGPRNWINGIFNTAGYHRTLANFPDDLELEALVDVLRGRVKLSVHCYEAVDLDGIVQLSNEFKFPVASLHHAAETYLVPDLLKKTWGGAPAAAIFAANARKKREAYRGSEFAPRILADNGIPVVMKSDHPVLNSRYLLYEAQQAHYYGLNAGLALASVTSTPANAAGVGWRVGKLEKGGIFAYAKLVAHLPLAVRTGYDADLVIFDSHPLALGATPIQVYIDGIAQLESYTLSKPKTVQDPPVTPNWDKDIAETIKWEGLPPLSGNWVRRNVRLTGVRSYWTIESTNSKSQVRKLFDASPFDCESNQTWTVLVEDGKVTCYELDSSFSIPSRCACCKVIGYDEIDVAGGSLSPGLTSFGSPLGLVEIRLEPTTNDGPVWDPLTIFIPDILGQETIIRAADGLQFEGRNTLLAYRGGVTTAVSAPSGSGFFRGMSVAFDVGSKHVLDDGAVIDEVIALHIEINRNIKASVSSQIAALRHKLLQNSDAKYWSLVRNGQMTLAVHVNSADVMASLIQLKLEIEEETGSTLRMTFVGGLEAPLLAKEIAESGISVIFTLPRPFPSTWESHRIVPGPPLTAKSQITIMMEAGVQVAIGVENESDAKNLRFDLGWAALESNLTISKDQALALGSVNVESALGFSRDTDRDLVVYSGGDFSTMNSKVIGVISPRKKSFVMFD